MKRKNSKRTGKSDVDTNGVDPDEEADSGEEPQEKKGRKSKGRKPRGKATEAESEVEAGHSDEDENAETRNENGNNQEKKGRKSKGKKSKQDKNVESEDEPSEETDPLGGDEDTEYEVEAILDEKSVKGVRQYLIRWKGYTEESDTWEPEDTLECENLIKEYKEKKKNEKSKPSSTKKKGGKEKKQSDSKETWDKNEDFEVSRILDVYFHRDGKRDFLVSWKGYPTSENSWEPEDNLDCKDLITRFMSKVKEAKKFEAKESKLRINPKPVNRLEFSMHEKSRRLSKRRGGKDRVHYFDAE